MPLTYTAHLDLEVLLAAWAAVVPLYPEAVVLHKHPDTAEGTAPYVTSLHPFLHTMLYNFFSSESLHNDDTASLPPVDHILENLDFF